jgi:hypothetical protein
VPILIESTGVILSGSGFGEIPWPVFLIALIPAVAILSGTYRQFFVQWFNGVRGRNWPTVSAIIDLVSVQKRVQSTGKGDIVTYVALLTYVYRNPDLQTGDYDKSFDVEEEARAWANSYKGCTVIVHVDPRNPARSALRADDLAAAVTQISVADRS